MSLKSYNSSKRYLLFSMYKTQKILMSSTISGCETSIDNTSLLLVTKVLFLFLIEINN